MSWSRRNFLIGSGVVGAGLSARSWSSLARGDMPSNRVRIGVIGTGVRGKHLIGNLPEKARVEAICDCATSRMSETLTPKPAFKDVLARFHTEQSDRCATFQDYRHMFDRVKLDAVIIATPDHHHVPAALFALSAGLDVYLEKPLSLTIREGRMLAEAVKRSGRVLQVGSQQRTMEVNQFACEFVRDGRLGNVTRVDVPNYPGPMAAPGFPREPIPNGVDWDLFLGPSSSRPHNRKLWVKDDFKVGDLLWRGWDLFRDYSGHLMTNWGGHSIDMVQYALGMDHTGPVKLELMSGVTEQDLAQDWKRKWRKKSPKPFAAFSNDNRFTPIRLAYANGIEMNLTPGVDAATFYGERGRMTISRNKYVCQPAGLVADGPDDAVRKKWSGTGHIARPHLQNWLDCIVSRKTPYAPVEVGHRSATVCHLVNIARELKRPLRWDPDNEKFVDDTAANRWLDRPRRPGFELPKISSSN